jgi:hypothetical protein
LTIVCDYSGKGDPARNDFITAQYHSVFSVTGEFMIRQGDYKLIVYGKNEFGGEWPPQLFHMKEDPWELHDIASTDAANLARMTTLLKTVYDVDAIDARAKQVQKGLFMEWGNFGSPLNASSCGGVMAKIYGEEYNATDAANVAAWLGEPCDLAP